MSVGRAFRSDISHAERDGLQPLKFLAALAILLFAALPVFAGTVTGTVTNGTTNKPAAGVEMILIQLQGGMQPVANTKTDANGQYASIIPASAPARCSSARSIAA